jgi:hypothetical protein
MKKGLYILSLSLLFGCVYDNQLKESYRRDRTLHNFIEEGKNPIFVDSVDCDLISEQSMQFILAHEKGKSLKNLYINVYLNQSIIYSGYFRDTIKMDYVKFCKDKKSGQYLWFDTYDTTDNLSYTWGQKNSVPILNTYRILLLEERNSDQDEYLIK